MTDFAPITAKILADSINPVGNRLTTWELTYPRFIHSELMTHRVLSRNAASSRAIPTAKLRDRVIDAPAGHVFWGANRKGMQADAEIGNLRFAQEWWLSAANGAIAHHEAGERLGLHKQIVNRIIEPWMMITVIVSATEWANFFHLRNHADAEPSFGKLAATMWDVYTTSMPEFMYPGRWHLPFVTAQDIREVAGKHVSLGYGYGAALPEPALDRLRKVSVGRCARVSYLTHDGTRDLAEDIALHDKLVGTFAGGDPGHFSPFEHVAQALNSDTAQANFRGWTQYRAHFPKEAGPSTAVKCVRCGLWDGHVTGCPSRTRT